MLFLANDTFSDVALDFGLPWLIQILCLKVPMKRNFFLHIFEIYRLKYTIPKFEMFRVKINDFTSLQSCAILPSKMVKGMGPS